MATSCHHFVAADSGRHLVAVDKVISSLRRATRNREPSRHCGCQFRALRSGELVGKLSGECYHLFGEWDVIVFRLLTGRERVSPEGTACCSHGCKPALAQVASGPYRFRWWWNASNPMLKHGAICCRCFAAGFLVVEHDRSIESRYIF